MKAFEGLQFTTCQDEAVFLLVFGHKVTAGMTF